MYQRVGIYYYFFPTYAQGKKIIWDGIDGMGFKFLDHFPPELIRNQNATEMKITLVNGSLFQIVGTDNYDSIVGTNPVGCVFSEFALQDPTAWEYVRPILRENGGWAIFPYTPRGFNHGWDLYQMAQNDPDWFCELLTVTDTGVLTEADVDAERRAGMPEPLIQQEFYCSFEHVEGMTFRELNKDVHMIKVESPPKYLHEVFDFDKMTPRENVKVYRSYDWGYAHPAAVLWGFSDFEGRLYIYRELYFADGNNIGSRLITREQARRIHDIEETHRETDRIIIAVADASIWDKEKSQNEKNEVLPSNAEIMASEKIYFDRQLSIDVKKSRLQGVQQIHDRLRMDDNGKPYMFVFSNCKHFWRTVPFLPCDPLEAELYDSEAEDHIADALRYLCSARPMKSRISEKQAPKGSFTDMMTLVQQPKRRLRY